MADLARKSGKKNRKHGNIKNKPAQKRYITNKARKIYKRAKNCPQLIPDNLTPEVKTQVQLLLKRNA